MVVYSAEAGATAEDGVFTPTLLEYLEKSGMSFTDILRQTRRAVYEKTGGKQIPGSYDQLFDPIYLAGRASGSSGRTGGSDSSSDSGTGKSTHAARRSEAPDGFVLVEAGSFTMGSPSSEANRGSGETQHTVTISRDFYMSKYEVTQEEYGRIMGSNPSDAIRGIGDNYPVNKVSWYDAVEYCNKRSKREGLTPCYSGSGKNIRCDFSANGYRLPTEAEWEYAARGGQKEGSYNVYAGSDNISSVAWYDGNSGSKTHPVGGKQANELGIYDMTGNVYEWCWDCYDDYPSGSVTDPTGPSSGSSRVVRGGCWGSYDKRCRSASRHDTASFRYSSVGFRLVRLP